MNNLIVIESDSDEEEIIFVGNNRADSEEEDTQRPVEDAQRPAEDAQRPIEDANQQSSSDEEPKELDPNIFESCSMCLLYFDSSAIWLPWGHCFHRLCILTEKNKLKMKQCPIWSRRIYNANCVRKLHINPSVLGSERMENLTWSNKRLEKRIRKIALEHEKLKDSLEAKEREAAALKSFIGQYEMDEKEASCGKEVDLQTIQRYTEGIVHAWCKRDDCEHAHKFMNAINSLKMGSDFEAESKRIISISNQRFLKEAVISELKSIKGHSLDSILPFYIERWRKLDNFDGMRERSAKEMTFSHTKEKPLK